MSTSERQIFQHIIAQYSSYSDESGLIHFVHGINMLIGILGEKPLDSYESIYGERLDIAKKKFNSYCKKVYVIENYNSGLTSERISKEDISSARFRRYRKAKMGFPITEPVAFRFFHLLIESVQLKDLDIPALTYAQIKQDKKRINQALAKEDVKAGDYKGMSADEMAKAKANQGV